MNKTLELSSPSNAVYKKYLSLTKSAGLKELGLFLLSGKDLVAEYLIAKTRPELICEIRSAALTAVSSVQQLVLSNELFKELDVLGTHSNILVLKQPEFLDFKAGTPRDLELVLPLGDPSNVGAALRSAEAFGVRLVILTKEAANPFLPKSVKASAGSVWRVPMTKAGALAEFGLHEVGLSMNGQALTNYTWAKNSRLLVGEEGPGLEKMKFQSSVKIETRGVESLNASVSLSIALFHYRTQHH
jgi:TrmH family RNA methyltransferase